MDIVILEVSEVEVPLWVTITSGVEGLSETKFSMDETYIVVPRSDDGESAEAFSWTRDNTELKEGICSGTLKTGGIVDDGMGICTETCVIEWGKHVASWYSWDIKGVTVEPIDKEDKAMIDERGKVEDDGPG